MSNVGAATTDSVKLSEPGIKDLERPDACHTTSAKDRYLEQQSCLLYLVLNPNTVARSYQELIREGLLKSQSGRGVFVAERRDVYSAEEQMRRLRHAAEQLCHEAILLGTPLPQVREILEAQWKELQREFRSVGTREERKKR